MATFAVGNNCAPSYHISPYELSTADCGFIKKTAVHFYYLPPIVVVSILGVPI
jgi:hypothetical protein